jgi:hypothetical protein
MAPENPSLGVTALLDDLLKDEQKLERDMAAFTGAADPTSQEEAEEPQLSAEAQRALSKLNTDMDSCLASLEDWKEESRLRRIKLERELEAEFGFSSAAPEMDESQREEPDSESEDVTGVDMSRYLGGAGRRQHGQRQPLSPLKDSQANMAGVSSSKSKAKDDARLADQERIDKLRAEVEAMRQQEAYNMSSAEFASYDPSDEIGGAIPDASKLNDWCDEVDAALEDPSFGTGFGSAMAGAAQAGLDDMQLGMQAAQSRVEADILEMEKLMAECNAAIQERKGAI